MKGIAISARVAQSCGISLLLTFLFASATAQAAAPGTQREDRDFYVPSAGYLRTVQLLSFRRNLAFRLAPGAPGQVTSLTGRRAIPTILIEFSNRPGQFTAAQYQAHLFGTPGAVPPRATISQYYRDMSLGQFEVRGEVLGWFRLPEQDSHYEEPNNGSGTGFGEFLTFGLDQADAIVDFGEFDNDGEDGLPNSGDDDGIVDTVFFVHAEAGAECGSPLSANNIWSHSWHYSEPGFGHTGPYVTNDVQLNESQVPVLNPDGTERHIVVEDYTVQPGLACPTGGGGAVPVPIGVYAHEYGHALGLPDLYDRTPRGNPNSVGIGNWCLMAGGSWGFDGNPALPTRMSAWSLARLGWAQLVELDTTASPSVTLEPVQENNLVYVIDVPQGTGKEFFLLEMKSPGWTDPGGRRINWDAELPAAGIAIWHVDESVGAASPTWPFAPLDQGQNDAPFRPNAPKHSLVALTQSDCQFHLEFKHNSGDTSDLWTSGQVFGDETCDIGSLAYDGVQTGIVLDGIDISQQTAQLTIGPAPVPPAPPGAPANVTVAEDGTDAAQPAAVAGPVARGVHEARAARAVSDRAAVASGETRNKYNQVVRDTTAVQTQQQAQLAGVNAELERNSSPAALTDAQKDRLLAASTVEIRQGIDPEQQKEAQAWVSQQRRVEVDADYEPETPMQANLKELWAAGEAETPISAQLDPTASKVDRVTGLNLPPEEATLAADAEKRKDTTLNPIIGDNVTLRQVSDAPNANAQEFQQVHAVGDAELPVFSKGVALYYGDDRMLKAIDAQTVDERTLVVAGSAGRIGKEEAVSIATRQLGLPAGQADKLEDGGEGIYLLSEDASQGRVVRRLTLPGSGLRKDIAIYVDEETSAVVAVE